jgi:trans-aconitate 2-methyltransferase
MCAVWNPDQYLKFSEERTRPARELAARIAIAHPANGIDLGCGPGNSTQVLAARWPDAEITGLDNSAAMIQAARQAAPRLRWITGDIAGWAAESGSRFHVVFSNAALQWVGNHSAVFPQLFARVAEGGALAVQMPGNYDAPQHRILRKMAASLKVAAWHAYDLDFYYDLLAPLASRLDLWATQYLHIMAGPEAIVEFYKGTALRPYLEALPGPEERERFTAEYLEAIRPLFPARLDGRVLFPFRRIFLVAYRD